MQEIREQVKAYVVDNFLMGRQAEDLTDTTSFLEKGILDSTGFLELVAFLEETYGLNIPDEELIPENLDSLNGLEAYIKRKLDSGS